MVAEIVGQIREAAYEAEDIIDTYVADMIRRRKMNLLEKVVIEAMLDFNLSDAMLDFRLGLSCRGLKAKDFDATLLTIKNFEVLTLCKWTFEVCHARLIAIF
ncbi:hypothetical protein JHK82_051877 [Glycine max]|uniref:Rx N-terminal domain-containing protein n=1 Tax=Glycine max TaxID=3847 RepID=C6T3B3_SOYBN|nr:uncharacterized protein LOC100527107 isoform 1 [Glycine max]ACU16151.1 unknown [Glycine max]KAG4922898.1 hypothetical protein JHK86_051711 [Glycine max]KAG5093099.1 hypothetical protein JHK82_051877 [Glycine max]KAG5096164.1 hypothetical protein JHK84_051752 [Glycine max]|eukprot:NP_001235002.1 uncharacterized protein LOC100527107 [Glycine max]